MSARWEYIGTYGVRDHYNGGYATHYAWSNGDDVAYTSASQCDYDDLSDIPHASCDYQYGLISEYFNGDIVAWMNDWGIERDSL